MTYYNRYDKKTIESFAIETISKSYDSKFSKYNSPNSTDNFDFLSEDLTCALEVTTAIPDNMFEAYKFEKEQLKGKDNLSIEKIDRAKLDKNGKLISWRGGTMKETERKIVEAINTKEAKAKKRLQNSKVKIVDLCICLQDGSLFDLKAFKDTFKNFDNYIFINIFFITPSYFIRYNKDSGFQEFSLKI